MLIQIKDVFCGFNLVWLKYYICDLNISMEIWYCWTSPSPTSFFCRRATGSGLIYRLFQRCAERHLQQWLLIPFVCSVLYSNFLTKCFTTDLVNERTTLAGWNHQPASNRCHAVWSRVLVAEDCVRSTRDTGHQSLPHFTGNMESLETDKTTSKSLVWFLLQVISSSSMPLAILQRLKSWITRHPCPYPQYKLR